jgi:hypothetical protein
MLINARLAAVVIVGAAFAVAACDSPTRPRLSPPVSVPPSVADPPGQSRTNYTGTYTLTVVAEGTGAPSCGVAEVLQPRVYTARVEQSGADLKVSLTGATFIVGPDGTGNGFVGKVMPAGEIEFWIRPSDPWDYGGPDIAERLSDGTDLYVVGTITAASSPSGIAGKPNPPYSTASIIHRRPGAGFLLWGSDAGCPITRFDMERR